MICRFADGSVNFFPDVKLWKLCVPRYSLATSLTNCNTSANKNKQEIQSLYLFIKQLTCNLIIFSSNLRSENVVMIMEFYFSQYFKPLQLDRKHKLVEYKCMFEHRNYFYYWNLQLHVWNLILRNVEFDLIIFLEHIYQTFEFVWVIVH